MWRDPHEEVDTRKKPRNDKETLTTVHFIHTEQVAE